MEKREDGGGIERTKERARARGAREERRKSKYDHSKEGEDAEERRRMAINVMEESLDRRVRIEGIVEREGEGGRKILLIEVKEEEDREELLEKKNEVRRRWGIGVDEDLTMEERKLRWRLVEKAKEERSKGRSTLVDNRRLWVDGKEWKWDEEKKVWWEKRGSNT